MFTSAQLMESLIFGIDALSTDEYIEYYKSIDPTNWRRVESCAIGVQESLEERISLTPEDSQDYICPKFCLSVFQGLIEESISQY